jgi:hypothetical protein
MRMVEFLVKPVLPAAAAAEGDGAILKAREKRGDDDAGGNQEIFHVSIPFNMVDATP